MKLKVAIIVFALICLCDAAPKYNVSDIMAFWPDVTPKPTPTDGSCYVRHLKVPVEVEKGLFVVAPEYAIKNYCSGSCEAGNGSVSIGCGPDQTDDLSVVVIDDKQKIKVIRKEKWIVLSCKCQVYNP